MPPPPVQTGFVDLPQCRLHYAQAGKGQPLIIVPATISELNNWLGLVQFMAQKFSVYFFELPGHGQSTSLAHGFSTDQVITLIADWSKQLHLTKFSLMGFSFGGILTLETLAQLNHRINQVILLSPLVSSKTIRLSRFRKELLIRLNHALKKNRIQSALLKTAHNQKLVNALINLLTKIGHVETAGPRHQGLKQKLLSLRPETLQVLVAEMEKILTYEFNGPAKFTQPCYYGMSINDPLLDYNRTTNWMQNRFSNLTHQQFDFPYHQPPQPLTFQELNKNYRSFLDLIK